MGEARRTEIMEHYQAPTSEIPVAAPVTVTTASTEIAVVNTSRKHILLQNNSTEPCIVRLGAGDASVTAYHFVLSKSTGSRDGLGASITIENYQGAIQGICENNSTVISVMEVVE